MIEYVAIMAMAAAMPEQSAPLAPPPPSPFEVGLAQAWADGVVAGDLNKAGEMVADNVQVGRTTKYPGSTDFEIEFEGFGKAALEQQSKFLLEKLGKPTSVSCQAEASICKFEFSTKDRMLLTGVKTRHGKVAFVQFIYMTREMIMRRQGK